ncbi:MAG: putative O-glycosylation ligase, exosortase A system-associated [Rhodocyclaceae bacterium]|nr:putative O-glycosylation ligase, exosortase A system-associated [Rhodocyclaceae bacterium]
MRDLFLLGAMLVFVPLGMLNAFIAYLLCGWVSMLSPAYYLYGFMDSVRFNLIFAVVAIGALLIGRNRFKNRHGYLNPTVLLMLAFMAHGILCAIFAYSGNPLNETLAVQFVKTLIYCLLAPLLLTTRYRFHALLLVLALGLGFQGAVEGLKVIKSGGAHRPLGIPSSMMSDNNQLAVAMVMVLPILFYLYQYSKNRLLRIAFLGTMALTVACVLGTMSRGGLVGLLALALWFVLTSRHKLVSLVLIVSFAAAAVTLAPERMFSRVSSMENIESDSSFMGRVAAWKISSAVALQNPVFGGGFHAIQYTPTWDAYRYRQGLLGWIATPPPDERGKAAHNIFFEVLGDMGFVGLGLFGLLFVNAFRARAEIRRRTTNGRWLWARDMSDTLFLSLFAYMISGSAVSMAYFEPFYVILMAMEMLRQWVRHEAMRADAVALRVEEDAP